LGLLSCKSVIHITYTVLVETLNHAQSINLINQSINQSYDRIGLTPLRGALIYMAT